MEPKKLSRPHPIIRGAGEGHVGARATGRGPPGGLQAEVARRALHAVRDFGGASAKKSNIYIYIYGTGLVAYIYIYIYYRDFYKLVFIFKKKRRLPESPVFCFLVAFSLLLFLFRTEHKNKARNKQSLKDAGSYMWYIRVYINICI